MASITDRPSPRYSPADQVQIFPKNEPVHHSTSKGGNACDPLASCQNCTVPSFWEFLGTPMMMHSGRFLRAPAVLLLRPKKCEN